MARYEFKLPDIGEGLAEAEVGRWLVAVGDRVTEDQPVVEMMTDKATVELPAPGTGVVVEQRAGEGDTVKTGAVLYVLETEGDARVAGVQVPAASTAGPAVQASPPPAPAGDTPAGVLAPPAVRKLARELGVDLGAVRGTGPGGRISAEDVKAHRAPRTAEPVAASAAPPGVGAGRRSRLRGVQKRMAETMALSASTIPHVTGFHELDAEDFVGHVTAMRRDAESRGRRIPFDTFFVRAAAIALRKHPIFNSSLDIEREEIVTHDEVNVGVATATPDGLVVPVVRRADTLDLEALAAEVDRVTSAARERRLAPADLRDGTFTLSNTGAWRGGFGTSLIRPPEVGLVAFGRVETRPAVRDGVVVARALMPMSVTFDHRVIDGEQGLTFALTLRELIEDPRLLFGG